MHKTTDLFLISLNSLFGFLTLDAVTNPISEHWNLNILTAILGLLWLCVERLPKAIYYLNKAWIGVKATLKGEKLDKDEYLTISKDKDNEN
jgi:hypothetical protein